VLTGTDVRDGRPARLAVGQRELALGARLERQRAGVGEPALEVDDRVPGGVRVDGEGDLAGDVHRFGLLRTCN
jgi:hypothetical protein